MVGSAGRSASSWEVEHGTGGPGIDDLAVGTPGEDLDGVADAGAVISLCGFDGRLFGCAVGVLRQANPEAGDAAGSSLTAGNFDGNEFVDLAVGAPRERVGAAPAPLFFQGGDLFAASLAS